MISTYMLADGLAVVTPVLGRGGTLNPQSFLQLREDVTRASHDGARALLLRSEGPVFGAGFDLSVFVGLSTEDAVVLLRDLYATVEVLEALDIPTVAAVQGPCLGSGLELMLACDFAVASESAQFGQVEVLVGGTTFVGGIHRLAERCGTSRALEIALTGDLYTASTFERWGIVNRIAPDDRLSAEATALAARFANGPSSAYAVTKQIRRAGRSSAVRSSDEALLDLAPAVIATADMQSNIGKLLAVGPRAFMADAALATFEGR